MVKARHEAVGVQHTGQRLLRMALAGEPRVLHRGRVRGRRRPPELCEDAARAEAHRAAGLALHKTAPLRTQLSTFQECRAQVRQISIVQLTFIFSGY